MKTTQANIENKVSKAKNDKNTTHKQKYTPQPRNAYIQIQQTQQNSRDRIQTLTRPKQGQKRAKMPLKAQKRRS